MKVKVLELSIPTDGSLQDVSDVLVGSGLTKSLDVSDEAVNRYRSCGHEVVIGYSIDFVGLKDMQRIVYRLSACHRILGSGKGRIPDASRRDLENLRSYFNQASEIFDALLNSNPATEPQA